MDTQQRQETVGEAHAGAMAPGQRLARYDVSKSLHKEPETGPKEWQDRLRSLEHCICDLLIKNQQLRSALESASTPEKEKQDD